MPEHLSQQPLTLSMVATIEKLPPMPISIYQLLSSPDSILYSYYLIKLTGLKTKDQQDISVMFINIKNPNKYKKVSKDIYSEPILDQLKDLILKSAKIYMNSLSKDIVKKEKNIMITLKLVMLILLPEHYQLSSDSHKPWPESDSQKMLNKKILMKL